MQTLQVNPSEKDYEVRIELGNRSRQTEVGIAIWYSETHMTGIGIQGDEVIARIRKGGRPVKGVEGEKVRFLKIRLKDQCVNFFYSLDGIKWTMNERTQEVSAYTNNALGGSSYLRPAIYAKGIGKAAITSFKYKAVK
jgi:beta-xylosidase